MRDPAFREAQWARRYEDHVAPINQLVDELIQEVPNSTMPYVPPYHGGINAVILQLYRDPGPMTSLERSGSGFIGCENDDPTADLIASCLDDAGVDQALVMPWNAYPWYLPEQAGIGVSHIVRGIDPLRRLLALMPAVHTVVTHGRDADESWTRFTRAEPTTAERFRHFETFHTSGRGITNGGRQARADGVADVVATYRSAVDPPR